MELDINLNKSNHIKKSLTETQCIVDKNNVLSKKYKTVNNHLIKNIAYDSNFGIVHDISNSITTATLILESRKNKLKKQDFANLKVSIKNAFEILKLKNTYQLQFTTFENIQSSLVKKFWKYAFIEFNFYPNQSILQNTVNYQIYRVFENFISNSIHAANKLNTYPKITINIKSSTEKYKITVKDNCGGIKGNLQRVFEPTYTTKNSSGIGLYVAKLIIENELHGKINIKRVKKGILFTIYISKQNPTSTV